MQKRPQSNKDTHTYTITELFGYNGSSTLATFFCFVLVDEGREDKNTKSGSLSAPFDPRMISEPHRLVVRIYEMSNSKLSHCIFGYQQTTDTCKTVSMLSVGCDLNLLGKCSEI